MKAYAITQAVLPPQNSYSQKYLFNYNSFCSILCFCHNEALNLGTGSVLLGVFYTVPNLKLPVSDDKHLFTGDNEEAVPLVFPFLTDKCYCYLTPLPATSLQLH